MLRQLQLEREEVGKSENIVIPFELKYSHYIKQYQRNGFALPERYQYSA